MVPVDEALRRVRDEAGVWLTPQQIKWWARKGPRYGARVDGRWLVEPGAIIDEVRAGTVGRGSAPTSRAGALVRAVRSAGGALAEARAETLLNVADGAPKTVHSGGKGRPRDGRVESLGATIKAECGVTVSRVRLSLFFDRP